MPHGRPCPGAGPGGTLGETDWKVGFSSQKRVVRRGPRPLSRALDMLGLQTPREKPPRRGGGGRGTVPTIPQRSPGSQPRPALLLRSTLRDRKEGQRLVLVGFIFFQCSVTFLANLRFEICLLARF